MLTKPLREGMLNQSSLRKFFILRSLVTAGPALLDTQTEAVSGFTGRGETACGYRQPLRELYRLHCLMAHTAPRHDAILLQVDHLLIALLVDDLHLFSLADRPEEGDLAVLHVHELYPLAGTGQHRDVLGGYHDGLAF